METDSPPLPLTATTPNETTTPLLSPSSSSSSSKEEEKEDQVMKHQKAETMRRRRRNSLVLTWVLGICVPLMFGYEIANTGRLISMVPFRGHTVATMSCYCLAAIVSLFVRRLSLVLVGTVFYSLNFINVLIIFLMGSQTHHAHYLGSNTFIIRQILMSIGFGITIQSVPLFLSEKLPKRFKNLSEWFQPIIAVGVVLASLANYGINKIDNDRGRGISFLISSILAVAIAVSSITLYRVESSMNGINQITKEIIEEEFKKVFLESRKLDYWKKIMEKKYIPHLCITIMVALFQQIMGINFILYFGPLIFKSLGSDKDYPFACALIVSVVYAASTLATTIFPSTKKRRDCKTQLVGTYVDLFILQVGIGLVGICLMYTQTNVFPLICLYVVYYNFRAPEAWLRVRDETFPVEIRRSAQSLNVSFNIYFSVIISLLYSRSFYYIKLASFLITSIFTMGGCIIFQNLIPQTKGKSTEEMLVIWKEHKFWAKYVYGEKEEATQLSSDEDDWVVLSD